MQDFGFDSEFLKKRGLTFGGRYLPYNALLQERAKDMRKNLTLSERKMWKMYLQDKNKRGEHKITILKQKVIDHYIVDFYVPQYNLVIEIDGSVHDERQEYDAERTKILEGYGLQEIRFTNNEVQNHFETVCSKLETLFNRSCAHPL